MLYQHYLDPIFLLSKCQTQAAKKRKGIKWKHEGKITSDNEENVRDEFDEHFLDRIVTPDERLAMQRDFTAVVAEIGVVRRESELEFGSGQVLEAAAYGRASCTDTKVDECLTFRRTASDRVVAEEARGKTVRDLSRLWKYLGGKSPVDHEHNAEGYHNEPPHEHREHRKHRRDHPIQRKADEVSGYGLVLEQQKSPIASAFDHAKLPFPHPSPTTDEQFFHVSSSSEPTTSFSERPDLSQTLPGSAKHF